MPCQPGGREGCPPNRWPQSHSNPGRRYFFANSWRLEELDSFPGKFREKLSSATNQSSNHKANTGLKKYSRGKQRPCVAAPSPAWLQRGITMADTQHPKQYLGIRGVTKIFLRLDRCHTPSLPAWRPTLLPGLRVSPNTLNIIPLSGQIQVKAGYPAVSICPFPSHYEADIQSCYLEKQQQNHLHGNFFIFIFGYGACLLLTSPRCSPGYPQNLHPACKLEGFKTTEIGHLLQAL